MLPMVARGGGPPQALRRNALDLEERREVAILRLRRGKVNALDLELLLAITDAVRAVGQARAVVITGSGAERGPGRKPGQGHSACGSPL